MWSTLPPKNDRSIEPRLNLDGSHAQGRNIPANEPFLANTDNYTTQHHRPLKSASSQIGRRFSKSIRDHSIPPNPSLIETPHMYTIAKLEGQLSNHPEQLKHAISEFRKVLRLEQQDLNSRYQCADWRVVIFRGDYHSSDDPERHLTARGYKNSTGCCHWGIHIYEDGGYTVAKDTRKRRGRGRKELVDIRYEIVWTESRDDPL